MDGQKRKFREQFIENLVNQDAFFLGQEELLKQLEHRNKHLADAYKRPVERKQPLLEEAQVNDEPEDDRAAP